MFAFSRKGNSETDPDPALVEWKLSLKCLSTVTALTDRWTDYHRHMGFLHHLEE